MNSNSAKTAFYYDDSGYVETLDRPAGAAAGRSLGLMGRQVAGKEFLDAYLSFSDWSELAAVVPNARSGRSLLETCSHHPTSRSRQRRLRLYELKDFSSDFLPNAPANVIYFPCPPDVRFAWARQRSGSPGYALSGVTHTLCSVRAVEALRNLITAPFERFDRLICTSRAVVDMVRAVTQAYTDYLRERHGGHPQVRIGLEQIPLGVDIKKFHPATDAQRAAERRRLQIAPDEVAVLFVGRLSHHAKAHPFPMFRALSLAAKATRQKVHLVLSGWASGPAVLEAFRDGARRFAGNVRVSIVDGTRAENRFSVWRAADIFTSLSDNIQETFGLVIVEAMACGLPIVASDWNGYRDLVADGETGFLVPTWMIRDDRATHTLEMLLGEVDYDHFLARTSQAVAVDVNAAAGAYAQLLKDGELRHRMGRAGRERAEQQFAWPHIIRRYEALWARQEAERAEYERGTRRAEYALLRPAAYPQIEHSFAGYPSCWFDLAEVVTRGPQAQERLDELLATPLVNYEADCRCSQPALLHSALRAAASTCPLSDLETILRDAGLTPQIAHSTLAWLLKYDLLRPAR